MFQNDKMESLLRKYIDDELDETECRKLTAWIRQSPENRELFINFISLYKTELQLNSIRVLRQRHAEPRFGKIGKKKKRFFMRPLSIAASAVLLFGAVTFFYIRQSRGNVTAQTASLVKMFPDVGGKKAFLTISDGSVFTLSDASQTVIREKNGAVVGYGEMNRFAYKAIMNELDKSFRNEIFVPRGGEYSLTLSDGSTVWLNAETRMDYPVVFSSVRSVNLSGGAFFEVAADTENPFVVTVGGVQVRAVGTKFNIVSHDARHVVVTLNEGLVEVLAQNREIAMRPGDQLEVNHGRATLRRVNPDIYSSWVTGTFEFDNTSLEEISAQLALWYDVHFEFESPELRQIKFSGAILKNKSLGYALELIRKVSGVDFGRNGDVVVVSLEK